MLRLSFLFLASILSIYSFAQVGPKLAQLAEDSIPKQPFGLEEELIEFTELEYQLIEASGLLSLSQQVKSTAQQLIALSLEQPKVSVSTTTSTEKSDAKTVLINHAQHFAIAKNLAKKWTEAAWQQRLLKIVHAIPRTTQKRIRKQLSQPLLQAAQRKEQAAISAQHSAEYRSYMDKLRQRPPSASRWQLVEDLDKQSGFSKMIIQARLAVIKEIQQQVKGWQPEELWQNQARQEVLEFLFYAYRKTPNNELKHTAQDFNQPELNQFYTKVHKTIH